MAILPSIFQRNVLLNIKCNDLSSNRSEPLGQRLKRPEGPKFCGPPEPEGGATGDS